MYESLFEGKVYDPRTGKVKFEKKNIPLKDAITSLNGIYHNENGNGFPKYIVYDNVKHPFKNTYYTQVLDSFEQKKELKKIGSMPHRRNIRIMNNPPAHAIRR